MRLRHGHRVGRVSSGVRCWPGSVLAITTTAGWHDTTSTAAGRRRLCLNTGGIPVVTLAGKEAGTTAGTATTSRAASARATAGPTKANKDMVAAAAAVVDSRT